MNIEDVKQMAESECTSWKEAQAGLKFMLELLTFVDPEDEFDEQGVSCIDLGQHYMDALVALTKRKAYSKSSCAQMIAEQSAEVARLRGALEVIEAERLDEVLHD